MINTLDTMTRTAQVLKKNLEQEIRLGNHEDNLFLNFDIERSETIGDITTHPDFFDCECGKIHSKEDRLKCPHCECIEQEMPDARINELIFKDNHFNS